VSSEAENAFVRRTSSRIVPLVEANDARALRNAIKEATQELRAIVPGDSTAHDLRRLRRASAALGGALVSVDIRRALGATEPMWLLPFHQLTATPAAMTDAIDAAGAIERLSTAFCPRSFAQASPVPPSKRPMLPSPEEEPGFDHFIRSALAVLLDAHDGSPADWHPDRPQTTPALAAFPDAMRMLCRVEQDVTYRFGELSLEKWVQAAPGVDPSLPVPSTRWNGVETHRINAALHLDAKSSGDYAKRFTEIRFTGQLRDAFAELRRNTSGPAQTRLQHVRGDVATIVARSHFDRYAISAADQKSRSEGLGRARIRPDSPLKHGGCPGDSPMPEIAGLSDFSVATRQLALLATLTAAPTAWQEGLSLVQHDDRLVRSDHVQQFTAEHRRDGIDGSQSATTLA